ANDLSGYSKIRFEDFECSNVGTDIQIDLEFSTFQTSNNALFSLNCSRAVGGVLELNIATENKGSSVGLSQTRLIELKLNYNSERTATSESSVQFSTFSL